MLIVFLCHTTGDLNEIRLVCPQCSVSFPEQNHWFHLFLKAVANSLNCPGSSGTARGPQLLLQSCDNLRFMLGKGLVLTHCQLQHERT